MLLPPCVILVTFKDPFGEGHLGFLLGTCFVHDPARHHDVFAKPDCLYAACLRNKSVYFFFESIWIFDSVYSLAILTEFSFLLISFLHTEANKPLITIHYDVSKHWMTSHKGVSEWPIICIDFL